MRTIDDLTPEQTRELLRVFALNWLAHDGCWFLAAEHKRGLDEAIELDTEAWRVFAATEARRVKKFLQLDERPGLDGLAEALNFRMYAAINTQKTYRDGDALVHEMEDCRVQSTRRRKNLPPFPCKSVGIVEFSTFAATVDDRIETECVQCPPDEQAGENDAWCRWRFTLRS
jgi:hypothetical protein